jgi:hypothetical protein
MFRGCPFVVRTKEGQRAFREALDKTAGEQPEFATKHWRDYIQQEHSAARDAAAELFTWGFLMGVMGGTALAIGVRSARLSRRTDVEAMGAHSSRGCGDP